jgi:EmrB/QacA subfamily drug resistance transporter
MLAAQLMVILDLTVVNIALPHIATGLHFSTTSLSWVMNGYTLAFGGLLLLGGRAGDILVSGYPDGQARTRALAIYTAVVTGGGSLGLVLGGLITEWLSWRWVLFVNVPIGLAVLLIGPLFVAETPRQPGRFDLAGAITSTIGMASLVYAFIRAASDGWGSRATIAALVTAVVLLGLFVLNETRAQQPITPLRLFADASRSGSFLARLLLVAGMFGMFFFLTQFVQEVLGFSPLRAGLAFLPMTITLFGVSRLAPRLMARLEAKPLLVAGLLPVIAGMTWLSRVSPGTSYAAGVLGPMLLLGAGLGLAFVPLTSASLAGVAPEDSGAASSMVNVMQQVGGSLGLAALVTVFGTASRNAAAHPLPGATRTVELHHVLAHGMSASFLVAAIFDACALVVVLLAIRGRPARAPAPRLVSVGQEAAD